MRNEHAQRDGRGPRKGTAGPRGHQDHDEVFTPRDCERGRGGESPQRTQEAVPGEGGCVNLRGREMEQHKFKTFSPNSVYCCYRVSGEYGQCGKLASDHIPVSGAKPAPKRKPKSDKVTTLAFES